MTTREQRVLRFHEPHETPLRAVITPAADYLFGPRYSGYGYRNQHNGPLEISVRDGRPDAYPRTAIVISPPWTILEYQDYLAITE